MKTDRFISGIYNYCDYWCERCAFTRRCRNFAMGDEIERQARGEKPVDDATRAGVARAIGGLRERDECEAKDEEIAEVLAESRTSDAYGSAKLVLVSIERSAAAWVRLREILPSHEDELLALLAMLGRLQRGLHAALPGAQDFKRPGLD